MWIATHALLILGWAGLPTLADLPQQPMVELSLRGTRIEGTPLSWDQDQVRLLGRDGRLWEFSPRDAADYRKSADRFRSLSVSEFRGLLLRELGPGIEVSGTGHYMVAHQQGDRDLWAERFEDLYRSAVHYFSVRGFQPADPPFPLVGIVSPSQQDFQRYAAREGIRAGAGVLGYYAFKSNRIILYDVGQRRTGSDWKRTASVIIHEATHQTAFNTGIHNRFSPPPLWVAEGLATMFEAPGVYDSRRHPSQPERINVERYEYFRKAVAGQHRPELLADVLASDRLFGVSPLAAYAEAWALTFYLVETQPKKYFEYLGRTARRAPFSEASMAERVADFKAVFGNDLRMFEAQFLRFLRDLATK